jgi:hypothetical protein
VEYRGLVGLTRAVSYFPAQNSAPNPFGIRGA